MLDWYDTKTKKQTKEEHVGTVQTDTPEALATAVAAALPDLGCRRRSISVSACPQLYTLKYDKNARHTSTLQ